MDFNEIITNVLVVLITGLFTFVVRLLQVYLTSKIKLIESEKDDKYYELKAKYITIGKDVLFEIMMATESSIVKSLRDSEGKLSKEEGIKIKEDVTEEFKTTINNETKKYITDMYGDLDNFIDIIIESSVDLVK